VETAAGDLHPSPSFLVSLSSTAGACNPVPPQVLHRFTPLVESL